MMRLAYLLFRAYAFFFRPVTLGVRIMMIRSGEVALIRQTYIPGWYLPGGGVKRRETLDAAARREACEETGADIKDLTLVGAYTHFTQGGSDHNVLFLCTDFTLVGKPDREIAELRFFPLDALPAGLWPGHRARIEEFRAHVPSPSFGRW
jgi:8-oxo-dGTP pyrophosphatase MutT (NUDIX family)